MKIKVGKYTLYSDRYSYWITVDTEKSEKQIAGYCVTMERLLEDFMDKRLKESEAETFKEAIETLNEAVKEAKEIVKASTKGKFEKEKKK